MGVQERAGGTPDPLEPLRRALLRRARADADAMLAEADAHADRVVADAREQAETLLAQAREQGELDAAEVLARERSRTERSARSVVLAAHRTAYESLRRAARDAGAALRHHPDYPAARAALAARAARDLGSGSAVHEVDRGGVVGVLGSRSVSYTLDGLADEVLDRIGPEVEELWRS